MTIKWSLSIGVIVFPIILLIGYFILNQKDTQVEWIIPWIIYGTASVLVFINSMLLSFIEGCDSVGDIQKIRFYISFIAVATTALLLISNADLFALAISLFISAMRCIYDF